MVKAALVFRAVPVALVVRAVVVLVAAADRAQAARGLQVKDHLVVTVLLKQQVAAAVQVLLVAMRLHQVQRVRVGREHPIALAARR
jgi:hypothetical protein